jgi:threonine/homoserine/homoserine lactone efflux protein
MWQAIISGFTLGCILALSVGPVIFTIIKQSLNNGHTGGFSFVAGVWMSDIILVVISNAFSYLVADLLEYKNVIGYIGSIFLLIWASIIYSSRKLLCVPMLKERK